LKNIHYGLEKKVPRLLDVPLNESGNEGNPRLGYRGEGKKWILYRLKRERARNLRIHLQRRKPDKLQSPIEVGRGHFHKDT